MKVPSTLEKARKLACSDPDVIYGYFDMLKQEMERLNIVDRPECIYYTDETNLHIDPQKN